jgi:hypothetical protein
MLQSEQVGFSSNTSNFVPEKIEVKIFARTPAILTEAYHRFPQSLWANTRIVPQIRLQPLYFHIIFDLLFTNEPTLHICLPLASFMTSIIFCYLHSTSFWIWAIISLCIFQLSQSAYYFLLATLIWSILIICPNYLNLLLLTSATRPGLVPDSPNPLVTYWPIHLPQNCLTHI